MTALLLPSPDSVTVDDALAHYAEVLTAMGAPAVEVRLDAGDGKGKGVFATRDIPEGETVFTERPLVSLQHTENYASALVCHRCLRFVGSVELQIGHKLRCLVDQLRGTQQKAGGSGAGGAEPNGSGDGGAVGGSESKERAEGGAAAADGEAAEEAQEEEEEEVDLAEALEAGERLEQIYSHVTPERIQALCEGAESLPLADDFQLPPPVPCRRGCGEVFCGRSCEQEAWEHSHCLLCTGPTAAPAAAESAAAVAAAAAGAGPSSSSAASGPTEATAAAVEEVEEVHGIQVDRRAVAAFVEHAKATNEIFLLAAQVVAATLLRAARLLEEAGSAAPSSGEGSSGAAAGPSTSTSGSAPSAGACRTALAAAWRPYVYGWKRCWWEAVAVPDDVEDEEEFRGSLRELASDSLELLSAAISDPRFGAELMQLEVYGSIVGMFELNNLGLSVSTPVEDLFLAVDEMEEGRDKMEANKLTQPLLDALDSEYATPCEATAFLALQSCINHSCDPNCTAACDSGDRTATLLAQRDIAAGDEISLSYIDVSLPYKRRQAELRDYGFVCRCGRCVAEAAAARAKKAAAGGGSKGHKIGKRR